MNASQCGPFIYPDVVQRPPLDTSNNVLSDLPNAAQVHEYLPPLTVPRSATPQRQHAEGPRPSFAQLSARLRSQTAAWDMSAMGNTTVANTSLDRRALGNAASSSASLDPSAVVNTAPRSASLDRSAVENTTVPNMFLDMSALRHIAPGSASSDTSALGNTALGSADRRAMGNSTVPNMSLDPSALRNIAPGSASLDRSALVNTNNDTGWSPLLTNCENPISRPTELDANMNIPKQSTGSSAPLQSCNGPYGDFQTPPVPASSLGSSHLSLSSTDQVSPVSQFGLFGSSNWANVMQETALRQDEQKVKKNQERIERRRNRNKVAAARSREKAKMKAAEDSQKIQEQAETIEKLRKIVASQKIVIDHYPTCAACGNIPS
ncbi:CCAAT/enhancer-binding protein-like isoform X2 [Sycon ciliatum]|uniref:CCAAT/enhancer-binding protein-like isoform X2 n=1 Tax=Sycon ciliatum TaxID=27933 RepID=UPI0031F6F0A0